MATRTGQYNKRIGLEAETKVSDGQGGWPKVWVSVLPANTTISAAIRPISATEILRAGQNSSIATHRINIRYRSVLKPAWRITFGNQKFNIVSIRDIEMRHREIEILVKELVV